MVHRLGGVLVLACAALGVSARPALAQQTLNLSVGYFMMPSEGRVDTDILLNEHAHLVFDVNDFNGMTVGGEWLVPIGNLFEAGTGVSFSRRTVPTVHARLANSDGSPIKRDLGLRQLPMAFTARVLPLGQSYGVQPYVGGGVALIKLRFSESGDFVGSDGQIVRAQYATTGTTAGPLVLFGLRAAGDTLALGFEARYQRARGNLGLAVADFANLDIDLGGWTLQFTTGMRFGE